eukprot:TRINITY_DN1704_c3_g1_i1.p1 TRINITY_DN1704_c3_g1~~TRINITY_DN1704_c3_g1_i1.p1  ORF type:complete len:371 (+),score=34.01 TRINITY_DN1704_c3_g1_i1:60-1172(+)
MLVLKRTATLLLCAIASVWLVWGWESPGVEGVERIPTRKPRETTPKPDVKPAQTTEEKREKSDIMETNVTIKMHDAPQLTKELENGVVLILYGGRFGGGYFTSFALPRMASHFFRCFPYPLHIFHEDTVKEDELVRLRNLVPMVNVTFELISFSTLPKGVSEEKVQKWKSDGSQKKFQGRGYRQMCRFWAGVVWSFNSLKKYKYYLRLDTDSIIPARVPSDPFKKMARNECSYGFNRLKGENPFVTTQLWETTKRWIASEKLVTHRLNSRLTDFSLKKGSFWGPMYYNNFELGTFALKNHPIYKSFFTYIDSHEPYGIFRYRWGDAPLHTLAVTAILEQDQYCNFTRKEFPYQHNPDKKDLKPLDNAGCH